MQTKLIGLLGCRRLPNLPSPPDVSYLDPEVVLPNWKRREFFQKKLFSEPNHIEASEKFDKLRHSRQIGSENRQIFMFSYENRWAIAGGLFQVSLRFPEEFNRFVANQSSSSGAPQIYRLSPLHSNLSSSIPQGTLIEARERAAQLLQCESIANHEMRLKDLDTKSASFIARSAVHLRPNGSPITRVCYLGNCSVRFGAPDTKGDRPGYLVDIYLCCDLENGDEWILFGNDNFFNGDVSPYHYSVAPQGRELISKQLEHDALFAAEAAPYVLAHLGFREPVFQLPILRGRGFLYRD